MGNNERLLWGGDIRAETLKTRKKSAGSGGMEGG